MKKYLSILVIMVVVAPSIAFASWWNPLSWRAFPKTDTKTQALENRIKELERKLENKATSTSTLSPTLKSTPAVKGVMKTTSKSTTEPQKKELTFLKNKLKTFTLPNGLILDEIGNIIGGESVTTNSEISTVVNYTDQQISNLFNSSVVRIETNDGSGSGFFYDKNGNILTANHVVEGFDTVKVILMTNESFVGSVVWRNEYDDIAIVNVGKVGAPAIPLGNSDSLQIGDESIVLGYPLGLPGMVLSKGIINSKQKGNNFHFLGTDANTQPGSSGGPWLNRKGQVIGLHVMGIGPQIQGIKANQGLNFAVPISYIKSKIPSYLQFYTITVPPIQSSYSQGSTINIKMSIKFAVDYNPTINCDQLSLPSADMEICNLYKNYKSSYTWKTIDNQ